MEIIVRPSCDTTEATRHAVYADREKPLETKMVATNLQPNELIINTRINETPFSLHIVGGKEGDTNDHDTVSSIFDVIILVLSITVFAMLVHISFTRRLDFEVSLPYKVHRTH